MALKHALPLEVIQLNTADDDPASAVSSSLLKTPHLQLMKVLLKAGHALPEHHVPGEITIQCLSGLVDVTTPGRTAHLSAGTLLMLPAAEPHGVHAQADAVLLVTLVRP